MNVSTTRSIPISALQVFDELLKSTNGRYISSPYIVGNKAYLYYGFDETEECNNFEASFVKATTPIVEKSQKKGFLEWLRRTLRSYL